jgi:hypothetical protein
MKILYLDLGMGAAGDMLAGALLDLLPAPARGAFLEKLNACLPEGVEAAAGPASQCGVGGLHFSVHVHGEEEHPDEPHHHHHSHAGLMEIGEIVAAMGLEKDAKDAVMAVYEAVAEAESEVHGVPVTELHFHELGALDAVADITAVTLLLRTLGAERVVCSPVAVGSGTVRCAHGLLPVPAPATAKLLRSLPCYAGEVKGELCTPTGAALLRRFASGFGPMPAMTPEAVGYGFGTKEFPDRPNCVRAILGEDAEPGDTGEIVELSCNLDDMTPEAVGCAMERLYAAGAVEVFTLPAGMKKNRPGVLLTALCRPETREQVLRAMFAHTSTLGIRGRTLERWELERSVETVETALGPVRRKTARGFGVERRKWEYEDLARIASERGIALEDLRRMLDDGSAF